MTRRKILALMMILFGAAFVSVKAEDHDAIMDKMAQKKDEHTIDYMASNLGLTGDQQNTMKTIFENRRKKMQDLQKEVADKRKALEDDTQTQITSNLTDDQKAKYPGVLNQLQKEEEQQKEQHFGGGQGGDGSQGGGMGRHGGHHGGTWGGSSPGGY